MQGKKMSGQKYKYGDHVRVKKDLGDCEAIVVGSYKEKYYGNDTIGYTVYVQEDEVSWCHEHQLELIERDRSDMLEKWVEDAVIIEQQKSISPRNEEAKEATINAN